MKIFKFFWFALSIGCCVNLYAEVDSFEQVESIDLQNLYDRARLNDPRMVSSDAIERQSHYREREARSSLLPQVSVEARVTRTQFENERISDDYMGERYSISLTQVLFDRALWHGYQRNRALSEQQVSDAREQRNRAAADLVQRYFEVLAAEDSLALVRAEQRVVAENLNRIESLYERQMAPVTDLLEISARKDRLRSEELQADNLVQLARESLSELVGQPVIQPLQRINEQEDLSDFVALRDLEFWQHAAITQSPYLQSKQHDSEASRSAYREARGGHYPRVTFSLSSQKSNIGYENAASGTSQSDVAAVSLQIPLYSGGGVSARAGSAYESIIISEQQLEAARREVLRETRSAFLNVSSGLLRIHAAKRALESTAKARVAADRSFSFGMTNAVDVLDRAREEFSAQSELLSAQYSYLLAYTLLKRWTGVFDEEDINRLNSLLTYQPAGS